MKWNSILLLKQTVTIIYMYHSNASILSCIALSLLPGILSAGSSVANLECSHEEADTCLLLHAHHAAASGCSHVTIKSPDTDVAVLAAAFSHAIPAPLFFLTGTGSNLRLISMNAMSEKLGKDASLALLAIHAFTGCDTTSAFAHRGKKAALKTILGDSRSSAAARDAFGQLGSDFQPLSADCLASMEKFVCMLYNTPTCSKVNDAWYELFCTKGSQSNQLPPCRDALVKHCARANYQTAVWRRCLEPLPDIPPPHQNGQGEVNFSQLQYACMFSTHYAFDGLHSSNGYYSVSENLMPRH